MKIAICCFYEAYPPISGAAAVSFNIAKFLPGKRLLIQGGRKPGTVEVDGLRVVTVNSAPESRVGRIASLGGRIRTVVSELLSFGPDVVILEGASWAVYHCMLLRAIRRSLPGVRVVYHSHNVEYVLRRQRNGRMVAAITRWAESRVMADCDLATAVSDVDRALFSKLYGVDTVLLPNGVDISRFSSIGCADVEQVRTKYRIGTSAIVFSGLYAYPPNRIAVDFLLNQVMPALLTQVPGAQLVVTGSAMPRRERWLIAPGIVSHDELPALIGSCRVAATPVFSGSGTRLKILEAMAARVPVVATSKAAEGLPFHDGEHLLIANDPGSFVESVRRVIVDSRMHEKLGSRGHQAVREHFDWKTIASKFNRYIETDGNGAPAKLAAAVH